MRVGVKYLKGYLVPYLKGVVRYLKVRQLP